jgi:hypothetical protein
MATISESTTTTTNGNNLLNHIAQVAGLSASVSLVCSVIYNFAFFKALGISFSEIPLTINDHVTSTFVWLPITAVPIATFLFLEIWSKRRGPKDSKSRTKRREQMLVSISQNKSFPIPFSLKLVGLLAIMSLVAMMVFADQVQSIIRILITGFSIIALWGPLSWWLVAHPRLMLNQTEDALVNAFIYVPLIAGVLVLYGYTDAKLSMLGKKHNYDIKLKSNQSKLTNCTFIRNFEKIAFINYSNSNIIILNQEDISSATTHYDRLAPKPTK